MTCFRVSHRGLNVHPAMFPSYFLFLFLTHTAVAPITPDLLCLHLLGLPCAVCTLCGNGAHMLQKPSRVTYLNRLRTIA